MNNTKIFILHYAIEKPIAALLKKDLGGSLHVEFEERSFFLKFKPGDPVVVCISENNTYSIKSGDIDNIINKGETVAIKLDETVNMQMQSRRKFKRYPASQFCDVKGVYTKKKGTAILKNVSSHGLFLYSKNEFKVNDVVEASVYFGNIIFFIEGKIVREIEGKEHRGYGISIKDTDLLSLKNIREFMRVYQYEFIKSIDADLVKKANDMDFVFDFFEESNASERINDAAFKLYEALRRHR
ncbi:PilZ domain-containing protein [Pseudoclostridium thermosuccinogenes]|jgi:hypothetical protein|uniref:PilZ domain-containing protein n=1 Tax=Clostridium thermosuccinogenes TaxID=84032 RepID=UPI002FDB3C55